MGLDIVEVVMRCEESFDISLDTARLEQMRTVGDLFELICEQLSLPHGLEPPAVVDGSTIHYTAAPAGAWSRDSVWLKLVRICTDQLQVKPDQVRYGASFVDDLGAD
jgi:acyl carrier protein